MTGHSHRWGLASVVPHNTKKTVYTNEEELAEPEAHEEVHALSRNACA